MAQFEYRQMLQDESERASERAREEMSRLATEQQRDSNLYGLGMSVAAEQASRGLARQYPTEQMGSSPREGRHEEDMSSIQSALERLETRMDKIYEDKDRFDENNVDSIIDKLREITGY